MSKYLDDTGTDYLIEKIKTMLGNKMDKNNPSGTGTLTMTGNIQAAGLTDGTTTKTMTEILEGGGSTITVDSALSSTSENPVQNKIVNSALLDKMDKVNPTGTGYLSLNRKANTTIGNYSVALGNDCEASGTNSHAEGSQNIASGADSHVEGSLNVASGGGSHAEGSQNTAYGLYSHVEGNYTVARGKCSHVEGSGEYDETMGNWVATSASGFASHAEGIQCTALGEASHVEGYHCSAYGPYSHIQGKGNDSRRSSQFMFGEYADTTEDLQTGSTYTNKGKFIEIVGNGTAINRCSNARTLDWNGNEVLAGWLTMGSNSYKAVAYDPNAVSTTEATLLDNYYTKSQTAKIDLSNVTYPANTLGSTTTGSGDRVIETYISSDGNTWYRKWASGWKECGSKVINPSVGQTIYYPVSFSTSPPTLCATIMDAATNYSITLNNIETTYFTTAQNLTFRYYACGY